MIEIKKLFEVDLVNAFASKEKEVLAVNATFQVNVSGAGEWYIDTTSSGPSVTAGKEKADCTVDISSADFQTLVENPTKALGMIFTGKLKISGNKSLAMNLVSLIKSK